MYDIITKKERRYERIPEKIEKEKRYGFIPSMYKIINQ